MILNGDANFKEKMKTIHIQCDCCLADLTNIDWHISLRIEIKNPDGEIDEAFRCSPFSSEKHFCGIDCIEKFYSNAREEIEKKI